MLNKFSRSIRKYLSLSLTLSTTFIGLLLLYINQDLLGNVLLISASLIGLFVGCNRMLDTLRHGYYGVPVLQLVGIVFAIIFKQPQVAAILAVVLCIELPLTGKNGRLLFQAKHAPSVKLLDGATLPYSVMVFLIGGAMWTVTNDNLRFLSVVASASTAPLLLAAPLTLKRKISELKAADIHLASPRLYELLADAKTVFLKKSGVLIEKRYNMSSVITFGKSTKSDVMKAAAALAYESSHPVALGLVAHAKTVQKADRAKHAKETVGKGIIGRQKGTEMIIGRLSFLEENGIDVSRAQVNSEETIVYVAQDGICIGAVTLSEQPYEGVNRFASKLKKLGIKKVVLLSGASKASAAAIAKTAGISEHYGDITVSDAITQLESEQLRPVVYIGSDALDEVAFPKADVGISADPAAISAAVTIDDYSIPKLLRMLESANQARRKIWRLVVGSLLITFICILLAAAGILPPLYASLTNLAITLLVLILTTNLKAKQPPQSE